MCQGRDSDVDVGDQRGIIPRSIEEIFRYIHNTASPTVRFLVRASYLQIYNEVISDLLKPERTNLTIREDKKRGVFVEGLSEWVVRSPAEIYGTRRVHCVRRFDGRRTNSWFHFHSCATNSPSFSSVALNFLYNRCIRMIPLFWVRFSQV